MKKNVLLLAPLFIGGIISLAQAQSGNIWYFGEHAGLDFSSGSPVFLSGGRTGDGAAFQEGTSSISDSDGNLLIYTDGKSIWNKNHEIIPGGDSLRGGISSTQSSLIVPQPGFPDMMYVFTTDDFLAVDLDGAQLDHFPLEYGFRYTLVDMCDDGGLGTVVVGEKNVLLVDTVAEKLCAVRHANGTDYWILVHTFFDDAFHALHLSSQGFVENIVTHIGTVHGSDTVSITTTPSSIGQMKFSPNGERIALVIGNRSPNLLEIFDFDTETGVVSNGMSIPIPHGGYGVEFSGNSSLLYYSANQDQGTAAVYQLNLLAGDANAIALSRVNVSGGIMAVGMQLGPDGKIYIVSGLDVQHVTDISVIYNPNEIGVSCNVIPHIIVYPEEVINYFTFPSFVAGYEYDAISSCVSVGLQKASPTENFLFPNPNHGVCAITSNIPYQRYTILNSVGDVVHQGILSVGLNSITIDNVPGLYFLKTEYIFEKFVMY